MGNKKNGKEGVGFAMTTLDWNTKRGNGVHSVRDFGRLTDYEDR